MSASNPAIEDSTSENEVLESLFPAKKLVGYVRNLSDPVSQITRGTGYFLGKLAYLSKFIPTLIKVMHYLPYVSSVLITIDNLNRLLCIADPNKSTTQKIAICSHAILSIALTIVFSFTLAQPFAGLLASTATDFLYNGIFKNVNRFYKHFFGKVVKQKADAAELTELVTNGKQAYLDAKKQLADSAKEKDYTKKISTIELAININIISNHEKNEAALHRLNHEITKSNAKFKENAFSTMLAVTAFAGAICMFIPGLQPIGAGLLALSGAIYLTDKLFPIPFPWRKHLVKKPSEKKEIEAEAQAQENGMSHADINRSLSAAPQPDNIPVVATEPQVNVPALKRSQSEPSISCLSLFKANERRASLTDLRLSPKDLSRIIK